MQKQPKQQFKLGTKVILFSRGVGKDWPPERQEVIRISRSGHVFVSGAENVPFLQSGEEAEPGAFHFRFRIALPEVKKKKKKRPAKRTKRVTRKGTTKTRRTAKSAVRPSLF